VALVKRIDCEVNDFGPVWPTALLNQMKEMNNNKKIRITNVF